VELYQVLFQNQCKWHLFDFFPDILSTRPLYAIVAEQLIVPLRIRIDNCWRGYCSKM